MTPTAAQKDKAGQWWATYRGHYLLAVTEAYALQLGGPSNQIAADRLDAALATCAAGEPVAVEPWLPDLPSLPIPTTRLIAVDRDGHEAAVLVRADGRLTAVGPQYLGLVRSHCGTNAQIVMEQMGGQDAPIRLRVGDRTLAYLMPVLDREHAS